MTKNQDTELIQISVPTKKINLEVTDTEKIEIVLRPFKQRHFAQAISIINKYFDSFNSVRNNYIGQRKDIIDRYLDDEDKRELSLAELDAGFDEGMEIAKALMSVGGEVAEDMKTIISMSIYKATTVLKSDSGTERSPIDPDLDDLTWGECLVLLGSVVGLNIDFFNQNSQAMNLISVLGKEEPSPKPKQKDGAKSSPDSSTAVTAITK